MLRILKFPLTRTYSCLSSTRKDSIENSIESNTNIVNVGGSCFLQEPQAFELLEIPAEENMLRRIC